MYPILFTLFGINIYASPVFLILAIIIGIYVGGKEAERRGISRSAFTIYWTMAIPIALLFASLNGVLFWAGPSNTLKLLGNPTELLSGGLVSFGAVVILLAWGFVGAKIVKEPVGPVLDTISLMLPLILGIYRIGCILNGCCYGVETDSAIGLYLPGAYGEWAVRYPTQLMLMTFDFGLFALLWQWRLRKPADGNITFVFLISFTVFRFLLDGIRELPNALGDFSLHQLTSRAMLLITLYFMFEFRLEKSVTKAIQEKNRTDVQ